MAEMNHADCSDVPPDTGRPIPRSTITTEPTTSR